MIFQLECTETVECYCTETHVASMGPATQAWLPCERQVTHESEIPEAAEQT